MKTPTKTIQLPVLNLTTAARLVRRPARPDVPGLTCTAAKLRECLTEIGCKVDDEGDFSLLGLLRAVRRNADPGAARKAMVQSAKRSARKVFGPPARASR